MNKGGEPIKDTILFGKYRLIRILGRGRSGVVYLALHLELEEYRAIKQVPKSSADYEQFKKEALLLKRLKHPGIPIVYDLEEDTKFSYLIEEFLEGDSFYDLVKKRGHLNQEAVIRYGLQICDLVHYLHSAEKIPILYLDLQPRNLLLCHEQVKLLDFDHAGTIEEVNEAQARYGTPGFCAPEQYGRGQMGVYTDVYQIGKLLEFLWTGHITTETESKAEPLAGDLGRIIQNCVRPDIQARYLSAAEVKAELQYLHSKTGVFQQSQESPLILVFAGTRSGVGTTHLAIGLSVYLRQIGYESLYEEWNDTNDVRNMADYLGAPMDSYGIYTIFGVPMKPRYGEAMRLKACNYPVVIRDYGPHWRELKKEETKSVLLLIQGSKWWERRSILQIEENLWNTDRTFLLYNHTIPNAPAKMASKVKREHCFQVPEFANPFQVEGKAASFYQELLDAIGRLPEKKKGNKWLDLAKRKWTRWKKRRA